MVTEQDRCSRSPARIAAHRARTDVSGPTGSTRGRTLVRFHRGEGPRHHLSVGDRERHPAASCRRTTSRRSACIRSGPRFRAGEDTSGAHPVTVISYQMWQTGSRIQDHREDAAAQRAAAHHRGVTPKGSSPSSATRSIWVPASMQATRCRRLARDAARGIGVRAAEARVTIEQRRPTVGGGGLMEQGYPRPIAARDLAVPAVARRSTTPARCCRRSVSRWSSLSVLLIACANVGTCCSRACFAIRRHDPLAIGAGRGRLKQLLTEGLILRYQAAGGLVVRTG